MRQSKEIKVPLLYVLLLVFITITTNWFWYELNRSYASDVNKLTYDLNVSQTSFNILNTQIVQGLCLPLLELK